MGSYHVTCPELSILQMQFHIFLMEIGGKGDISPNKEPETNERGPQPWSQSQPDQSQPCQHEYPHAFTEKFCFLTDPTSLTYIIVLCWVPKSYFFFAKARVNFH